MTDLILYTLLGLGTGIVFGVLLMYRWCQVSIDEIRSSWMHYANHLSSCNTNNRAYSPRVKRCTCGYAETLRKIRDEVSIRKL